MLSGRRYRLELGTAQAELCETFGNICRSVWNTALEQRREYRRRGAWMNYVPQAAEMAEAKHEFPWLADAPSHVLQQTLRDLDRACREHGTFKVRWRSQRRWSPSFRFPAGNAITVERIGRKWGRAKLPKLGWVRFRWSRPLGGAVRSATVSRRGVHWFVSFLVEDGRSTPEQHAMPNTAVGVDRGVKVAATTSDGRFIDRLFATPGERARLRRLQQKQARQKRGSFRRRANVAAIGTIHGRVRDRRTDFCARTAADLTTRHAVVVLEELRTTNMTRSASGTMDAPGAGVAQKAGLNRAILDKGWHLLELALRNAARTTGTAVVLVPAAYTSQTCNPCGHVDPKNRESQAAFECTSCGHRAHADVNAARNILNAAGHAVSGRGDLGANRSVKRQPPPTRTRTGRSPRAARAAGIPVL
ncbi:MULTISPECIES: RNA-guided endonuclease TnpB family protein [unclassified Kitasatospora]|uniref:RNA-guided endonuclease InsQ/TnpB family protein n=1 Tax=unclassified Kitasatospora TaxID=2633591 RepID=UPI00070F5D91|nr:MULTISPECIES: RNA-guided endonuclease TnpB family protein [unclassified Kitasatospora]KQV14314.1 transposase [Kitasatospora sp. Root107]KRB72351.1 transposase [Kitasatospora sp. Root187]